MEKTIIQQGAEAIIYKIDNKVVKDRIQKKYRISELDNKIRKRRTKSEAKLLNKASKVVSCPTPLAEPGSGRMIHMPFIDGKKISEHLDKFSKAEQLKICEKIGKTVAKLHSADIVHGDLTTSNMILKNNEIFMIDFGLGFISRKYEDKAVDLHLLRQALEAKHFKYWQELFEKVLKGYEGFKEFEIVLERLKAVEKRGRYKH